MKLKCFFDFTRAEDGRRTCRGKVSPARGVQNPTTGYCETHAASEETRARWSSDAISGVALRRPKDHAA